MEITKDLIYFDYRELILGRKYWLILVIMTPIFLLIGFMGRNILIGFFFLGAMSIYMICASATEKKNLKKIGKGEFVVFQDVIVDKVKSRRYKKQQTYFYVKSEKLYKSNFNVIPSNYDAVEIGQPFIAVYVDNKLIKFYSLATNTLSPEVAGKIKEK